MRVSQQNMHEIFQLLKNAYELREEHILHDILSLALGVLLASSPFLTLVPIGYYSFTIPHSNPYP